MLANMLVLIAAVKLASGPKGTIRICLMFIVMIRDVIVVTRNMTADSGPINANPYPQGIRPAKVFREASVSLAVPAADIPRPRPKGCEQIERIGL
jgi:hypothetical protein